MRNIAQQIYSNNSTPERRACETAIVVVLAAVVVVVVVTDVVLVIVAVVEAAVRVIVVAVVGVAEIVPVRVGVVVVGSILCTATMLLTVALAASTGSAFFNSCLNVLVKVWPSLAVAMAAFAAVSVANPATAVNAMSARRRPRALPPATARHVVVQEPDESAAIKAALTASVTAFEHGTPLNLMVMMV